MPQPIGGGDLIPSPLDNQEETPARLHRRGDEPKRVKAKKRKMVTKTIKLKVKVPEGAEVVVKKED
jgi:hypothetical protein